MSNRTSFLQSANEIIDRVAEKLLELTPAVYPVKIPLMSVANAMVSVPDTAELFGIDVDGRNPQCIIDYPFAKPSFFFSRDLNRANNSSSLRCCHRSVKRPWARRKRSWWTAAACDPFVLIQRLGGFLIFRSRSGRDLRLYTVFPM